MVTYAHIFFISLLLSLSLIALFRALATKINLVSSHGISCVGGPGIWLSFLTIYIVCSISYTEAALASRSYWGIILGSGVLIGYGIIDDYRRELSVPTKFLVQTAATILLILFGIRTQIAHIGLYPNLIITFLWVLGITNAFNHLDVMDGLAAGVAAISAAIFFLVAWLNNNFFAALLSLALTAILSGFLRFNLSASRVFMGNSGSHFLGFILAALAIAISHAPPERKIALLSPILILGLPILDTAHLIFVRMKKGQSVFKKSEDHFALRLLARGASKKQALLYMYLLALFFGLSGLILSRISNQLGMVVLANVVLVCVILGKRWRDISFSSLTS